MRFALPEKWSLQRIIQVVLGVLLVIVVYKSAKLTLDGGKYTWDAWKSLIVTGIATGSLYALIAMGYTLVYGILFIINFAHGEVFMSGAFSSFFIARTLDNAGFLNEHPIISIAILMAFAMLVSMCIAILLERIAYRPLRGAPRLVPLITAIGASLFLQNTFKGFFGAKTYGYPKIDTLKNDSVDIFGFTLGEDQLLVIVGAAILMIALYMFIERTKTGRAMRAVGEDKEISALMGIDVDKVIVTTFGIGGMLAGAAGVLWAFTFNQVDAFMGFFPGIKAFTSAVLGGIGNVVGAALGGVTIGLLEATAPALLLTGYDVPSGQQLKDVISFSVLIFVLIFKPGGILGSDEAEKV